MKRVLLTGGTGFIGRHALAPLLARGFEVHALSRGREPGATGESVVWHDLDLRDAQATEAVVHEIRASHLLHLAWYTEHGKFWDSPENLDWVAASALLVRAFREAGGERAVLAGTCAEYDWSGDCCDERTPLRPDTLYGASKDALRRLYGAYCRSTGLSGAWGRIFFTFGPGEQPTRVVAAVARALLAGEPVPCSSGRQFRDFLYVEDVADAFAALVAGDVTGPVDIGSGDEIALRDVLLRLERLAGREGLVRLGEAIERPEPARIVADSERLRRDVGWQPGHTLDDALERTLGWWRSESAATSSRAVS
ncbi:MAG TPA: NAD(P)-dependent oxidoreductase [Plantibacter sp.]|uniref:NAD-dependent epimerase/dehydratase family protein n=1 Tax=Plantibacter sp. TaxID=1871045 RepID=UPI002C80264C|nr:NAD(P)-dependent oxidoreductase [Plantibacter sp.]